MKTNIQTTTRNVPPVSLSRWALIIGSAMAGKFVAEILKHGDWDLAADKSLLAPVLLLVVCLLALDRVLQDAGGKHGK